jgi:hypothetical protein
MYGVTFYEEFGSKANKRKGISAGTVVAVYRTTGSYYAQIGQYGVMSAIGAVFFSPNSPVATDAVHVDYLADTCKRISEARAWEVHPNLFAYLA